MTRERELRLDADVSECGDSLSGTVTFSPDESAALVSVSLVSVLQARGRTETTTTAAELSVDASKGPARFALAVPAQGPISFETQLANVQWRVEARFGDDAQAEAVVAPLTVLPAGGVAVWARQTAAPPSRRTQAD